MRMFTLDDEVVQSKARTASNKIGSVVWNLAEAEKTVLKAVEEVNKHSELSGIAYGSMLDKLEKTNDILEEYNQIESLVYDYCEEIDDNFFKEQEKILEGLSRLKVEDIRVPNNIGIVETRTITGHGETYTYEVKKKDIGFEDLLTYGTVSEIMQSQYNEIKNSISKGDQEYGGSINDYIKALIEDGQFDYEVAWKKNASLVIDLIPVVGDAKGIIECVVGKDLITGRELSGLERGLCALSIIPLIGDGGTLIKAGVKGGVGSVLKVLGKAGAENVAFYMGSAVMEEAGVNPLWGLAFYQFGRTGWKNKDKIIDALKKLDAKDNIKIISKAELNTCDSIKKIINNKGYSVDEFAQLLHPDRILSDSERFLVDSVRGEIGIPSADTLMCKTIPQSDIYKYLYNQYDGVRGFTAVKEHGNNLKTLLDKYNGARLDYNNTAFKTTNGVDGISQSVGMPDKFYGTIEYKANDVSKISIPDWAPKADDYPYTGKGFTGSVDVVLPEYFQDTRKFMDGDIFNIIDSDTGEIIQQFIYDMDTDIKWVMIGGK